ncbi:MAG: hypothetical protein A2928_01800 [Candidatus Taylorbacteria bacterium RIFCSPLOWO2_01_FULL_45_15b]|uniref:Glutamate--tRNA ligase n=1 Tax=Candidatus Taylorbacteria bacterium RIFCSPLOWO2_01_FULL_45_15b TaxID=1802319 RepID=A0A1G2NC38_9BACT|nr:MAG: hypothetical protein A2928_01800 [Candidatus Taylorbacteria bacterium RIFCSPLOWO2_01_FULL_45_15b]
MQRNNDKTIIVRFPPSPTGLLHIGGARTALFNYLFAKHLGGKIVLRYEDTDKERSKPDYVKNIEECLVWLGIKFDGEPVYQSKRTEIYKKYLKDLVVAGQVYESKEEGKEVEGKRSSVLRFKNPNIRITWNDLVRGEVTFDTTDLGDFVVAKSFDEPLYHLAVVVDDFEMGITHVLRGEDHISNTPRQILIQRAINAPQPLYGHIPLILAPDRSKLSKRHGAVAVTEYRDRGYLPEALINYLALLGWNPGTDKEMYTPEELIADFSLDRVQKGGAIFNEEKLRWINKQHMKRDEGLSLWIVETLMASPRFAQSDKINAEKYVKRIATEVVQERLEIRSDLGKLIEGGEVDYFFLEPKLEPAKIAWKQDADLAHVRLRLQEISRIIGAMNGAFSKDDLSATLMPYAEKEGKGNVLWPLRYSLTGKDKSPDPFTVASIIGKEEVLLRLSCAILAL